MNTQTSPVSLRAKTDYVKTLGSFVATAEFKRVAGGNLVATWFVTGVTKANQLACLFTARIGLKATDESSAVSECDALAPRFFELAEWSIGLEGTAAIVITNEVMADVLQVHLRKQFEILLSKQQLTSMAIRAARAYELCKSFGYSKTTEAIANFESLPVSTIKRRLDNARNLGLIAKTRSQNAKED